MQLATPAIPAVPIARTTPSITASRAATHRTTTSSPRHLRTGRRTFYDLWLHEWYQLRRRSSALDRATSWGLLDHPIHDLDEVLVHIGFEQRGCRRHEHALRRLLVIAADDQLAARTVLQRILPGLVALARQRAHYGDARDALEELVGVAWIVIRTFNPERRPSCLAAALLGDVRDQTFRVRRSPIREEPIEHHADVASEFSPSPVDEVVDLVRRAVDAGVTQQNDLELVESLLTEHRAIDVAARLDVTVRTYRNRRDRLTERLREVAAAA